MDKGLGSVTWWGFSPSTDLLELYQTLKAREEYETLNILLVGAGDVRHILKTVSRRCRQLKHPTPKLHFYILENNLELYARALLLLSIAIEDPSSMGLQEKVEIYAEVFGNTLIRDHTAQYVETVASDFVKMVTDFDLLKERLPFYDLENLKYKERDGLENIFKFWRKPEKELFDALKCWDLRVRQHLGTRYDSAKGVFDWDFSMKLHDRGAEIIGSRTYQQWRSSGVAFKLREGTYNVSNKTLASGMVFNVDGERTGRRGYWGDIVVSPYIAYGIECEEERFFKRANKEYISNSENVTEYNLTSLFHQLSTGQKYDTQSCSNNTSSQKVDAITEEDEEIENQDEPLDSKKHSRYNKGLFDGVQISFLPLNSLPDMASKSRYSQLFHMVYFSNSMVHHLVPPISDIFSQDALLILETAKFVTELNKEQYCSFASKIRDMAANVKCQPLVECNPEKDNFSLFGFSR